MFKSIKTKIFSLLALISICAFSCKKNTEISPVNKQVKLTTDSITQNGLTLIFINKDTAYEENGGASRKALENIFFNVYPNICAYFNPDAPRKVTFIIDPTYEDPGDIAVTYFQSSTVHYNPQWVLQNPTDLNVVTHESTHVCQDYINGGYTPSWLIEGLAEYSRNKFGIDNAAVGWYIPDYSENQKYTDGYTTVARFILWAEAKYKPGIAQALDKELRAGTYSNDTSWEDLTGLTFGQLWSLYVQNPYY